MLPRNDSIAGAVNPWDLDIPSDFRPQVGETGAGHFASILLVSDTSGHSLAFFQKYWLVRFATDGGMRKADSTIRQLL
jgi:hypothetical protein